MSIRYKPTLKWDPRNPQNPPLYYAIAVSRGNTDMDKLASAISASSTLSKADVHATVVALSEQVPDEILMGNTVTLKGLGTFSVSLRSVGVSDPRDLTPSKIMEVKLNFRTGPEMKHALRQLVFSMAKK